MNTPEAITSALWAERDQYPQLQNDEFESASGFFFYLLLVLIREKSF